MGQIPPTLGKRLKPLHRPCPTVMVQGTMSSVGKSLMVAALCRVFMQDGLRVAPFKAQNMALNSYATEDGLEVGRAQAMQAEAAGVPVTVEMNPVLIKPEAETSAQIVVLGKPWARLQARDYFSRRQQLWSVVAGALDALRSQFDLIVIEGAGSPVELNLRQGDLVNMAIAKHADSPVLLVGDIDRGGIFAQFLGTLSLLELHERARVRGLIVNKFRGDMALFSDGVAILEERGAVPVLGVVPYIPDLRVADEDSVALEERMVRANVGREQKELIDIVVVRLPHISNFDDFDPLDAEDDVRVRFVERAGEVREPDLIVLPGTKTTIADLRFLRERGFDKVIAGLAGAGTPVLGICGGYQMLGNMILDPLHVEAAEDHAEGLGLLPVTTTFRGEKRTVQATGHILTGRGLFAGASGLAVSGYEIHMGQTVLDTTLASEHSGENAPGATPLLRVRRSGGHEVYIPDGYISSSGWVVGTYFHGLLNNDDLRHQILSNLATRKGIERASHGRRFDRNDTYDRLANIARKHLDVDAIYRIVGLR